jgi:hypothetical protein
LRGIATTRHEASGEADGEAGNRQLVSHYTHHGKIVIQIYDLTNAHSAFLLLKKSIVGQSALQLFIAYEIERVLL